MFYARGVHQGLTSDKHRQSKETKLCFISVWLCWSRFSQFSNKQGKTMAVCWPTRPPNLTRTVPKSCPLIEARNGHKCPSDLFVPAISRSCCDPHPHHFCIFLSCLPPSPPRFLHGTVIFLFLRWIGFSAAVTSTDAAPLWFLPSFQKSLPLPLAFTSTRRPSPHPLPSLLASFTGQSCACTSV